MNNQHDSSFNDEYELNHCESVEKADESVKKNPGLDIDGLIVNNKLYKFKKAVDGKLFFTLVEKRKEDLPESRPDDTVKLPKIQYDSPVDESVRPGPRPKQKDSQLSKSELDRRNRRRAINRECARRARERRQRTESDLEKKLKKIGRAHGLNSSHTVISYAVFCLKKKKKSKIKKKNTT